VIKLGSNSRKYHKEENGNKKEVPTEVKVAQAGSRTSDSREPIMFSERTSIRWPRNNMTTRTNEGTNRKKINNKCGERKNPTSKRGNIVHVAALITGVGSPSGTTRAQT
jgi:hypothetical protein